MKFAPKLERRARDLGRNPAKDILKKTNRQRGKKTGDTDSSCRAPKRENAGGKLQISRRVITKREKLGTVPYLVVFYLCRCLKESRSIEIGARQYCPSGIDWSEGEGEPARLPSSQREPKTCLRGLLGVTDAYRQRAGEIIRTLFPSGGPMKKRVPARRAARLVREGTQNGSLCDRVERVLQLGAESFLGRGGKVLKNEADEMKRELGTRSFLFEESAWKGEN